MSVLIDAKEFMTMLQERGLVIVSAKDYEEQCGFEVMDKRRRYLKLTAITYKQLLDMRVLPITSKQAIEKWVERGVIKPTEVTTDSKGRRLILVSAIKRLGYV